jgi:hypothetical protein
MDLLMKVGFFRSHKRDMPAAHATILVNSRPDVVFAFIADARNQWRWQPTLTAIEGFPDAPVQVGASWLEVRRFGARLRNIYVTVTDYRSPALLGFTGDQGGIVVKGRFVFEAVGNATRVTQHMQFRGRGLMVFLVPLIARQSRDEMQSNLERLRATLSS